MTDPQPATGQASDPRPETPAERATAPGDGGGAEGAAEPGTATPGTPATPLYKGEPLNADRGPGLGCFWTQVVVLGVLLVLTPLTVVWAWDPAISAGLLILTLALLLFAGQTVIFLLRLVAADRRTRRRPLSEGARKTVGQIEEESRTEPGAEDPPSR